MIHRTDHFVLDRMTGCAKRGGMSEGIERRTIAVQLADRIEDEIREGTWVARLPGKRTLAKRFSVNIKTCASALELLEQRGVIGPGCAGQMRRIPDTRKQSRRPAKSNRVLLILHQTDAALAYDDVLLFRKMGEIWSKTHGQALWIGVDYPRYRRPGPLLEKLIQRHSASALMLHMCWVNWYPEALKRVPSYQAGGAWCDTGGSLGACSLTLQTLRIIDHFRKLGHRRILIPSVAWDDQRWGALCSALSTDWDERPPVGTWEDHCPRFIETHPGGWEKIWQKTFAAIRPTAVIVWDDSLLLSLYSYCFNSGLRIPRDISIIVMDHHKLLEYLRPRPTMLRYPVNAAAAHFQTWVDNDLRPIGRKHFDLEWMGGESVAPPRDRR